MDLGVFRGLQKAPKAYLDDVVRTDVQHTASGRLYSVLTPTLKMAKGEHSFLYRARVWADLSYHPHLQQLFFWRETANPKEVVEASGAVRIGRLFLQQTPSINRAIRSLDDVASASGIYAIDLSTDKDREGGKEEEESDVESVDGEEDGKKQQRFLSTLDALIQISLCLEHLHGQGVHHMALTGASVMLSLDTSFTKQGLGGSSVDRLLRPFHLRLSNLLHLETGETEEERKVMRRADVLCLCLLGLQLLAGVEAFSLPSALATGGGVKRVPLRMPASPGTPTPTGHFGGILGGLLSSLKSSASFNVGGAAASLASARKAREKAAEAELERQALPPLLQADEPRLSSPHAVASLLLKRQRLKDRKWRQQQGKLHEFRFPEEKSRTRGDGRSRRQSHQSDDTLPGEEEEEDCYLVRWQNELMQPWQPSFPSPSLWDHSESRGGREMEVPTLDFLLPPPTIVPWRGKVQEHQQQQLESAEEERQRSERDIRANEEGRELLEAKNAVLLYLRDTLSILQREMGDVFTLSTHQSHTDLVDSSGDGERGKRPQGIESGLSLSSSEGGARGRKGILISGLDSSDDSSNSSSSSSSKAENEHPDEEDLFLTSFPPWQIALRRLCCLFLDLILLSFPSSDAPLHSSVRVGGSPPPGKHNRDSSIEEELRELSKALKAPVASPGRGVSLRVADMPSEKELEEGSGPASFLTDMLFEVFRHASGKPHPEFCTLHFRLLACRFFKARGLNWRGVREIEGEKFRSALYSFQSACRLDPGYSDAATNLFLLAHRIRTMERENGAGESEDLLRWKDEKRRMKLKAEAAAASPFGIPRALSLSREASSNPPEEDREGELGRFKSGLSVSGDYAMVSGALSAGLSSLSSSASSSNSSPSSSSASSAKGEDLGTSAQAPPNSMVSRTMSLLHDSALVESQDMVERREERERRQQKDTAKAYKRREQMLGGAADGECRQQRLRRLEAFEQLSLAPPMPLPLEEQQEGVAPNLGKDAFLDSTRNETQGSLTAAQLLEKLQRAQSGVTNAVVLVALALRNGWTGEALTVADRTLTRLTALFAECGNPLTAEEILRRKKSSATQPPRIAAVMRLSRKNTKSPAPSPAPPSTHGGEKSSERDTDRQSHSRPESSMVGGCPMAGGWNDGSSTTGCPSNQKDLQRLDNRSCLRDSSGLPIAVFMGLWGVDLLQRVRSRLIEIFSGVNIFALLSPLFNVGPLQLEETAKETGGSLRDILSGLAGDTNDPWLAEVLRKQKAALPQGGAVEAEQGGEGDEGNALVWTVRKEAAEQVLMCTPAVAPTENDPMSFEGSTRPQNLVGDGRDALWKCFAPLQSEIPMESSQVITVGGHFLLLKGGASSVAAFQERRCGANPPPHIKPHMSLLVKVCRDRSSCWILATHPGEVSLAYSPPPGFRFVSLIYRSGALQTFEIPRNKQGIGVLRASGQMGTTWAEADSVPRFGLLSVVGPSGGTVKFGRLLEKRIVNDFFLVAKLKKREERLRGTLNLPVGPATSGGRDGKDGEVEDGKRQRETTHPHGQTESPGHAGAEGGKEKQGQAGNGDGDGDGDPQRPQQVAAPNEDEEDVLNFPLKNEIRALDCACFPESDLQKTLNVPTSRQQCLVFLLKDQWNKESKDIVGEDVFVPPHHQAFASARLAIITHTDGRLLGQMEFVLKKVFCDIEAFERGFAEGREEEGSPGGSAATSIAEFDEACLLGGVILWQQQQQNGPGAGTERQMESSPSMICLITTFAAIWFPFDEAVVRCRKPRLKSTERRSPLPNWVVQFPSRAVGCASDPSKRLFAYVDGNLFAHVYATGLTDSSSADAPEVRGGMGDLLFVCRPDPMVRPSLLQRKESKPFTKDTSRHVRDKAHEAHTESAHENEDLDLTHDALRTVVDFFPLPSREDTEFQTDSDTEGEGEGEGERDAKPTEDADPSPEEDISAPLQPDTASALVSDGEVKEESERAPGGLKRKGRHTTRQKSVRLQEAPKFETEKDTEEVEGGDGRRASQSDRRPSRWAAAARMSRVSSNSFIVVPSTSGLRRANTVAEGKHGSGWVPVRPEPPLPGRRDRDANTPSAKARLPWLRFSDGFRLLAVGRGSEIRVFEMDAAWADPNWLSRKLIRSLNLRIPSHLLDPKKAEAGMIDRKAITRAHMRDRRKKKQQMRFRAQKKETGEDERGASTVARKLPLRRLYTGGFAQLMLPPSERAPRLIIGSMKAPKQLLSQGEACPLIPRLTVETLSGSISPQATDFFCGARMFESFILAFGSSGKFSIISCSLLEAPDGKFPLSRVLQQSPAEIESLTGLRFKSGASNARERRRKERGGRKGTQMSDHGITLLSSQLSGVTVDGGGGSALGRSSTAMTISRERTVDESEMGGATRAGTSNGVGGAGGGLAGTGGESARKASGGRSLGKLRGVLVTHLISDGLLLVPADLQSAYSDACANLAAGKPSGLASFVELLAKANREPVPSSRRKYWETAAASSCELPPLGALSRDCHAALWPSLDACEETAEDVSGNGRRAVRRSWLPCYRDFIASESAFDALLAESEKEARGISVALRKNGLTGVLGGKVSDGGIAQTGATQGDDLFSLNAEDKEEKSQDNALASLLSQVAMKEGNRASSRGSTARPSVSPMAAAAAASVSQSEVSAVSRQSGVQVARNLRLTPMAFLRARLRCLESLCKFIKRAAACKESETLLALPEWECEQGQGDLPTPLGLLEAPSGSFLKSRSHAVKLCCVGGIQRRAARVFRAVQWRLAALCSDWRLASLWPRSLTGLLVAQGPWTETENGSSVRKGDCSSLHRQPTLPVCFCGNVYQLSHAQTLDILGPPRPDDGAETLRSAGSTMSLLNSTFTAKAEPKRRNRPAYGRAKSFFPEEKTIDQQLDEGKKQPGSQPPRESHPHQRFVSDLVCDGSGTNLLLSFFSGHVELWKRSETSGTVGASFGLPVEKKADGVNSINEKEKKKERVRGGKQESVPKRRQGDAGVEMGGDFTKQWTILAHPGESPDTRFAPAASKMSSKAPTTTIRMDSIPTSHYGVSVPEGSSGVLLACGASARLFASACRRLVLWTAGEGRRLTTLRWSQRDAGDDVESSTSRPSGNTNKGYSTIEVAPEWADSFARGLVATEDMQTIALHSDTCVFVWHRTVLVSAIPVTGIRAFFFNAKPSSHQTAKSNVDGDAPSPLRMRRAGEPAASGAAAALAALAAFSPAIGGGDSPRRRTSLSPSRRRPSLFGPSGLDPSSLPGGKGKSFSRGAKKIADAFRFREEDWNVPAIEESTRQISAVSLSPSGHALAVCTSQKRICIFLRDLFPGLNNRNEFLSEAHLSEASSATVSALCLAGAARTPASDSQTITRLCALTFGRTPPSVERADYCELLEANKQLDSGAPVHPPETQGSQRKKEALEAEVSNRSVPFFLSCLLLNPTIFASTAPLRWLFVSDAELLVHAGNTLHCWQLRNLLSSQRMMAVKLKQTEVSGRPPAEDQNTSIRDRRRSSASIMTALESLREGSGRISPNILPSQFDGGRGIGSTRSSVSFQPQPPGDGLTAYPIRDSGSPFGSQQMEGLKSLVQALSASQQQILSPPGSPRRRSLAGPRGSVSMNAREKTQGGPRSRLRARSLSPSPPPSNEASAPASPEPHLGLMRRSSAARRSIVTLYGNAAKKAARRKRSKSVGGVLMDAAKKFHRGEMDESSLFEHMRRGSASGMLTLKRRQSLLSSCYIDKIEEDRKMREEGERRLAKIQSELYVAEDEESLRDHQAEPKMEKEKDPLNQSQQNQTEGGAIAAFLGGTRGRESISAGGGARGRGSISAGGGTRGRGRGSVSAGGGGGRASISAAAGGGDVAAVFAQTPPGGLDAPAGSPRENPLKFIARKISVSAASPRGGETASQPVRRGRTGSIAPVGGVPGGFFKGGDPEEDAASRVVSRLTGRLQKTSVRLVLEEADRFFLLNLNDQNSAAPSSIKYLPSQALLMTLQREAVTSHTAVGGDSKSGILTFYQLPPVTDPKKNPLLNTLWEAVAYSSKRRQRLSSSRKKKIKKRGPGAKGGRGAPLALASSPFNAACLNDEKALAFWTPKLFEASTAHLHAGCARPYPSLLPVVFRTTARDLTDFLLVPSADLLVTVRLTALPRMFFPLARENSGGTTGPPGVRGSGGVSVANVPRSIETLGMDRSFNRGMSSQRTPNNASGSVWSPRSISSRTPQGAASVSRRMSLGSRSKSKLMGTSRQSEGKSILLGGTSATGGLNASMRILAEGSRDQAGGDGGFSEVFATSEVELSFVLWDFSEFVLAARDGLARLVAWLNALESQKIPAIGGILRDAKAPSGGRFLSASPHRGVGFLVDEILHILQSEQNAARREEGEGSRAVEIFGKKNADERATEILVSELKDEGLRSIRAWHLSQQSALAKGRQQGTEETMVTPPSKILHLLTGPNRVSPFFQNLLTTVATDVKVKEVEDSDSDDSSSEGDETKAEPQNAKPLMEVLDRKRNRSVHQKPNPAEPMTAMTPTLAVMDSLFKGIAPLGCTASFQKLGVSPRRGRTKSDARISPPSATATAPGGERTNLPGNRRTQRDPLIKEQAQPVTALQPAPCPALASSHKSSRSVAAAMKYMPSDAVAEEWIPLPPVNPPFEVPEPHINPSSPPALNFSSRPSSPSMRGSRPGTAEANEGRESKGLPPSPRCFHLSPSQRHRAASVSLDARPRSEAMHPPSEIDDELSRSGSAEMDPHVLPEEDSRHGWVQEGRERGEARIGGKSPPRASTTAEGRSEERGLLLPETGEDGGGVTVEEWVRTQTRDERSEGQPREESNERMEAKGTDQERKRESSGEIEREQDPDENQYSPYPSHKEEHERDWEGDDQTEEMRIRRRQQTPPRTAPCCSRTAASQTFRHGTCGTATRIEFPFASLPGPQSPSSLAPFVNLRPPPTAPPQRPGTPRAQLVRSFRRSQMYHRLNNQAESIRMRSPPACKYENEDQEDCQSEAEGPVAVDEAITRTGTGGPTPASQTGWRAISTAGGRSTAGAVGGAEALHSSRASRTPMLRALMLNHLYATPPASRSRHTQLIERRGHTSRPQTTGGPGAAARSRRRDLGRSHPDSFRSPTAPHESAQSPGAVPSPHEQFMQTRMPSVAFRLPQRERGSQEGEASLLQSVGACEGNGQKERPGHTGAQGVSEAEQRDSPASGRARSRTKERMVKQTSHRLLQRLRGNRVRRKQQVRGKVEGGGGESDRQSIVTTPFRLYAATPPWLSPEKMRTDGIDTPPEGILLSPQESVSKSHRDVPPSSPLPASLAPSERPPLIETGRDPKGGSIVWREKGGGQKLLRFGTFERARSLGCKRPPPRTTPAFASHRGGENADRRRAFDGMMPSCKGALSPLSGGWRENGDGMTRHEAEFQKSQSPGLDPTACAPAFSQRDSRPKPGRRVAAVSLIGASGSQFCVSVPARGRSLI